MKASAAEAPPSLRDVWSRSSSVLKLIYVLTLVAFAAASSPTLLSDYVTHDQLRAFRYSVGDTGVLNRLYACTSMIPEFYVRTGRPFVWMTECVEHAWVSSVSDFSIFRYIMLGLWGLVVVLMAQSLLPVIEHPVLALWASCVALLTPGVSFMAYQGATAAGVLVGLCLALRSTTLAHHGVSLEDGKLQIAPKSVALSSLTFLFACLFYPAWAFCAVPVVILPILLHLETSIWLRLKRAMVIISLYLLVAFLYYALVRITVHAIWAPSESTSLGMYEVDADFSAGRFLRRVALAADYFVSVPPSSFNAKFVTPVLLLFSIVGILYTKLEASERWSTRLLSVVFQSIGSFLILLTVAIAPWILSGAQSLETRHFIVWPAFVSGLMFGTINLLLLRSTSHLLAVMCFSVAGLYLGLTFYGQLQLARAEVESSEDELEVYEEAVSLLFSETISEKPRLFVVLRPEDAQARWDVRTRTLDVEERLGRVETIFSGGMPFARGSAWLASGDNPVNIPWIFTAALRKYDPAKDNLEIIYCANDQVCISTALMNENNIVLGYLDSEEVEISSPVKPVFIDVGKLSGLSRNVLWSLTTSSSIDATSTFGDLGPQDLLSGEQPGWHAASPPQFPESLEFSFPEEKSVSMIELTPQDGHPERMPGVISLYFSADGELWLPVIQDFVTCAVGDEPSSVQVPLLKVETSQHWKIEILSSCGSGEFLTLRKVSFVP